MLLKHMQQVFTVDQSDRLIFRELTAAAPVIAGRHKNTLRGSFGNLKFPLLSGVFKENTGIVSCL